MSTLEKLDEYVLAKTQKGTDFVYGTFGFTKYEIEKWAIILSCSSFSMFAVIAQSPALLVIAVLYSLVGALNVRRCEKEERVFIADGTISLPVTWWSLRVCLLLSWVIISVPLMLLPESGLIWLLACGVFGTASSYINACIPRPPRKSKVRRLFEKAREYFNGVSMPVPAFAPIRN